jgi:hypothetical protein
MKDLGRFLWLFLGLALGIIGTALYFGSSKPALANTTDRYEDYIICTGPVTLNPVVPTDGIWVLDYRSGKLLGTVIDRMRGKLINWAEVDLVKEFNIQPKQNVHFMMTTGTVTQGQAALYIAETTTGRVAVYTMGTQNGAPGLVIRRHDLTTFRPQQQQQQ